MGYVKSQKKKKPNPYLLTLASSKLFFVFVFVCFLKIISLGEVRSNALQCGMVIILNNNSLHTSKCLEQRIWNVPNIKNSNKGWIYQLPGFVHCVLVSICCTPKYV